MNYFDNGEYEKYRPEAERRWGGTKAYAEFTEKTNGCSDADFGKAAAGLDAILAGFAACRKTDPSPASARAGELVSELQDHITAHFYNCTDEILAGLGQTYVADERFRNNIDRHGAGTAEFIKEAIGYKLRRQ